jgi:predicted anti-sigma-YlaC factor YlaD
MHGTVRDRLENLLSRGSSEKEHWEVEEHLSLCAECSSELKAMKTQSELLQSLRAPGELEPAVGFYARVVQRIEERANSSIWSFLIDSPFGKRLAYASLAIALLLGTYVVSEESQDGHLSNRVVVSQNSSFTPVIGNQQEQRDAVLVNFASYQPGTGQ